MIIYYIKCLDFLNWQIICKGHACDLALNVDHLALHLVM